MDLYQSALTNFPAFESYIQENPAAIDTLTANNQTLLHLATHYNNDALVSFLLVYGVNFNAQDRGGYTALHLAILHRNMFALKILVLCADLNLKNKQSETPLLLACKLSKTDTNDFYKTAINLLIQNKPNINMSDINGRCPLYYVHDSTSFQLLHKKGADINARDCEHITVIMINVQRYALGLRNGTRPSKDILEYLLSQLSLQVNAVDKNRRTALHHAVILKSKETVRLLLNNAARTICLTIADRRHQTPLDIAMNHGDKVMIDLLRSGEKYSDEMINISDNRMVLI